MFKMFKIPEWDENIPTSDVNFTRFAPRNKVKIKNKKIKASDINKQNGFIKPGLKTRSHLKVKSKLKLANNTFKSGKNLNQHSLKTPEVHNKKPKKQKQKKKFIQSISTENDESKKSDSSIVLNHYDSDKLDELILDAKKKKLNSPKNLDLEDTLFTENEEKNDQKQNECSSVTKEDTKQITIKKTVVPIKKISKLKKNITKEIEIPKLSTEKNTNTQIVINKNSILNGKVTKLKKKKDKLKNKISEVITESEPAEKTNSVQESLNQTKCKESRKKGVIKSLLQQQNHRNSINISKTSTLRNRMLERLKAAKFRYLNEKLYTSSGVDAKQLFQSDPEAFQTYHEGYQQQVKKWPVKPLDVIIQRIQKMPKSHIIADMGCGEAELSQRVPNTVRSFDLVSGSSRVEACDMAHTPLLSGSVDAVVYCLALMGTDLVQYLVEANRVLKNGGHLLIAEVESRFDNVEAFTKEVQKLGFSLKKLDKSHKVFFFMELTKVRAAPVKRAKLPTLTLKPCVYKKR